MSPLTQSDRTTEFKGGQVVITGVLERATVSDIFPLSIVPCFLESSLDHPIGLVSLQLVTTSSFAFPLLKYSSTIRDLMRRFMIPVTHPLRISSYSTMYS